MLKRMSSRGFSPVAIIIALLVVAAITLGGWYVWQNREKKQSNNHTSEYTPSGDHVPEDSENISPAESSEYLIIDEWGLRITLPEEIRGDISYFINDKAERDFGGPIRVDFVSKSFSAGSLKCAQVEGNEPRAIASIYREKDGGSAVTQEPQPFKRVGDTRYYFLTTACEEAINKDGSAQDKGLLTGLKNAIKETLANN